MTRAKWAQFPFMLRLPVSGFGVFRPESLHLFQQHLGAAQQL
jgi:hypothetical protein